MKTNKILKKINKSCPEINVSTDLDITPNRDNYIREFNKGKSFAFTEWCPLTKYTNDDFKQDFVTYKTALLACKYNHVSSEPPVLLYDEHGMVIATSSDEWFFVFSSGISYNTYYLDLENANLGDGLAIKDKNVLYANSNAVTTEDIKVAIDLGGDIKAGDVVPKGTSIQKLLTEVFTSTRIGRSDGVPIYTSDILSKMPDDEKPKQYIEVPSEAELYDTKESSNYLNILFSAIRKLQSEVYRLKNSFRYGINSYSGTNTAMSDVVNKNVEDYEPLWATDQSDLSNLVSVSMDFGTGIFPFKPYDNFIVSDGKITVYDTIELFDSEMELQNCIDPKLYFYSTTNNLNINYSFKNESGDTIDVSPNLFKNLIKTDKYNILFVLSRKTKKEDEDYIGFNYLWISIGDYNTNKVLMEGYYNPNTKTLNKYKYDFGRCELETLTLNNTELYKFDICSKYQDFSEDVNPSTPSNNDYKYEAAHITIRAVKKYDELETIKSRLLNNELIWVEAEETLYIKSKDNLVAIGSVGGSSDPDNGMTENEIIELLTNMGIIYSDENNQLQLSSVSDITFVNNDTGKQFKFEVNPEGELISNEILDTTIDSILEDIKGRGYTINTDTNYRGFISRLLCTMQDPKVDYLKTGDVGVFADRVAISSLYAPFKTDVVYGCSHGFIELENISNTDIPLEGIYLHYMRPTELGALETLHLPLKGLLKAGSTYLIRCKKYADSNVNADVFINVDTYDQEWYINGDLLDLSIDGTSTYGFALTYGNKDAYLGGEHSISNIFEFKNAVADEINSGTTLFIPVANVSKQLGTTWKWYYIDSIVLNKEQNTGKWAPNIIVAKPNSIIKKTFALDPAKQAFNGCTTYDSSRYRYEKVGNDYQVLDLSNPEIAFPHSKLTKKISDFVPKSSKFGKNVSSDKTQFDLEKPNMTTCSFGIDAYTTRCFNWVSAGSFDEFVFIKKEGDDKWSSFESYKKIAIVSEEKSGYPRRKEFLNVDTNNVVYARISSTFPGCNINYTSHKCIIQISETAHTEKTVYKYIVGRKLKDGNPDLDHCSEEMTFTMYPKTCTPRIYQITDQQGFHWIEYQVWSAAAEAINEKIKKDCENDPTIIPVLINTGDMTQNGTRINEWLDYYNGGKCLFDHLEQMNVTGNNDLCGTDPTILGTGDDVGKSNSFYFHVFYCYEVSEDADKTPIILGENGKKYVPSLYYFDFDECKILMCNSEITRITCRDWYKVRYNGDVNSPVNVYTGWTVPSSSTDGVLAYYEKEGFVPIYTQLYNILKENQDGDKKKVIAVAHEMPFTVITLDSMSTENAVATNTRSFDTSKSSLVGCHMNQLSKLDTKGTYWFSRLLEYFKVKLCLGGHKHTFTASFPLREYYYFDNNTKNTLDNYNDVHMENNLKNDDAVWTAEHTNVNLTKQPIIYASDFNGYSTHSEDSFYIHPITLDNKKADYHGVVYWMLQATGYKLTSNKELPSPYQEFSQVIPPTIKEGTSGNYTVGPASDQKHPMFAIIDIDKHGHEYEIALVRARNILGNSSGFTQTDYGTGPIVFEYCYGQNEEHSNKRYKGWVQSNSESIDSDEVKYIITI